MRWEQRGCQQTSRPDRSNLDFLFGVGSIQVHGAGKDAHLPVMAAVKVHCTAGNDERVVIWGEWR